MQVCLKIRYNGDIGVGEEVDRYYALLQTICERFPNSQWGRGKQGEMIVGI
jgi:hypothetical protein